MGAVSWILVAIVADASAAPLQVTGATTCPSAAEVESALAGLIEPRDPEAAADVAELRDDAGAIVLSLHRPSGEPIGEKRLDAGLSCAERARTAAVVIAAWEARLGSQATALVVAPPPRPAALVQRRDPGPLPPPPPPPRAPLRLEPGVTAAAAINGTTLAPAGTIELAFSRPGGTVVPAIAALIVGTHNKDVGPGQGSWRRYGLLATAGSRRTWSRSFLEARAGIALTLLDISGSSYPINGSGVTFDPGIPFGARFGLRTAPVRWWIDATIAFWPRGQTLYVSGAPGSSTLPRGEALVGIGAAYDGR